MMQDEQQFNQLILQYTQLKNGAEDISRMIDKENFDEAITMLKNREQLFLSCACIRKYLELTPVQQNELNKLLNELRILEMSNIKKLEQGKDKIQAELKQTLQNKKFKNAYDQNTDSTGSIVNEEE